MKKILFCVLFLTNWLFADFNSLAEEQAYKKGQSKQEEMQRQAYKKKFDEIVIPRIKQLNAFNDGFLSKYLVRNTDTLEIIDGKFKNRTQLYNDMKGDFEASQAEYGVLEEARGKICTEIKAYCDLKISESPLGSENYKNYVMAPFTYGYRKVNMIEYGEYEDYLRLAYSSYGDRQKEIQDKAQKAEEVKKRQAVAEVDKKRALIVCKEWKAKAKKRVFSLGVGDRVVRNGMIYKILGVNANTFTVNLSGTYMYINKTECLPYDAPNQYCYQ